MYELVYVLKDHFHILVMDIGEINDNDDMNAFSNILQYMPGFFK
jgi:hypothetical protein